MPSFDPQTIVTTDRSYKKFMRNRRVTQYIDDDMRVIMQQKVYGTLILRMEFNFNNRHYMVNNLPVYWFTTIPDVFVADWFDFETDEEYSFDIIPSTKVYCLGVEIVNPNKNFYKDIAQELVARLVRAGRVYKSDMWRYKSNAEKSAVQCEEKRIRNAEIVNDYFRKTGTFLPFDLELPYVRMHNLQQLGLVRNK